VAPRRRPFFIFGIIIVRARAFALAVLLTACAGTSNPDNSAIVQDFQGHRSNVEVTADGSVLTLFPDRQSSTGIHEQFILRLAGSDITVEVEHNISIGARVPLTEGDRLIVHGEYIWNAKGGLIHFTHHDPQGKHEAGYIKDKGQTYD
jgi:hypothetical protein